jgi:hypothetical protein
MEQEPLEDDVISSGMGFDLRVFLAGELGRVSWAARFFWAALGPHVVFPAGTVFPAL